MFILFDNKNLQNDVILRARTIILFAFFPECSNKIDRCPQIESCQNSSKRSITSVISNSTQSFDVTSDIQDWVDGADNKGWVFYLPEGLWSFKSSQSKELLDRPKLTIVYENNY